MRSSRRGISTLAGVALLGLCGAPPAPAEVRQSGADAFLVAHRRDLPAPPATVFAALRQIDRWWNPQHSWSGSAQNLRLELEAGGCFCERWANGSVELARVVFVASDRELSLRGALGPLQEMGLDGLLIFALAPTEAGTRLEVSYRVTGDGLHDLTPLAPAVDGVIGDQASRLAAFVTR